jgi:inosine/xanthosine triphosphate pyrophosphatase family protein
MATKPFDSTIISQANVLEASREYSVINKDLDGKILVLEQGRPGFYGYDPSAKEQKESLCAKEMKNETKQIH